MSDLDSGIRPDDGPTPEAAPLDLDEIERDLRDVESSLARLADGTYFTDGQVAADPASAGRASVPGTDARPAPATPIPTDVA